MDESIKSSKSIKNEENQDVKEEKEQDESNRNIDTYETSDTDFLEIPRTNKEKVMIFLYNHPNKTIKQISEDTNVDYEAVKLVLAPSRGKGIFMITQKVENQNLYDITEETRSDLSRIIRNKKAKMERDSENMQRTEALSRKKAEAMSEIKNMILSGTVCTREGKTIIFDLQRVMEECPALFQNFEKQGEEFYELFILATQDVLVDNFEVRFTNFSNVQKTTIEGIRNKDQDKLFVIEGRVTSLTDIKPVVLKANFECPSCGAIISMLQVERIFRYPRACSCGRKGRFPIISEEFIDVAYATLEDSVNVTDSCSIKNIKIEIKEKLTKPEEIKKFNPGNDVRCLGILKAVAVMVGRELKIEKEYIFEVLEVEEFEPEVSIDNFTKEELEKFQSFCVQFENIGFSAVRGLVAPEVFGYDSLKDALIIQASQPKNSSASTREKSNILIVGDPGISKSVVAKYVEKITPGSKYVSGGGSTKVGLTATVEKSDTGYILKPGAVPLSRDVIIIDEFNLLSDEDKPKIQEAMSEQTISINKASIHTKLKVSCGFLCIANPKEGKFFPDKNLVEQFNLFPPLLNRFDFVFMYRDQIDREKDRLIAKRMMEREQGKIKSEEMISFARKFFTYIRSQPIPEFKEEMPNYIAEKYAELRINPLKEKEIPINPRFIETLIRGSKACARLRLSKNVEKKDIDLVLGVLKKSSFEFDNYSEVKM